MDINDWVIFFNKDNSNQEPDFEASFNKKLKLSVLDYFPVMLIKSFKIEEKSGLAREFNNVTES
ncbi:MAG: hypothetical protein PHV30_00940 [Candidatus Margulisbacteria bacterium]|nr:hypothetical protein [Candidatus Margulisiibacteriota bacterium]